MLFILFKTILEKRDEVIFIKRKSAVSHFSNEDKNIESIATFNFNTFTSNVENCRV